VKAFAEPTREHARADWTVPRVTLVIPTKNEDRTIQDVIERVRPYADEILVVDGHSTDDTRRIALEQGARVELDGGRGKGDGIRTAIDKAKGDVLVFIDADGSHEPSDIPKILGPILGDRADLVIGSRGTGGSDESFGTIPYFLRNTGGHLILLAINYRFGVRLTDSQNGFRAIRTEVARALDLQEDVTTIEQEMLIKALKRGYRVTEVPSHEYRRRYGCSRIVLWRVWHVYVWSVLKNLF
jgi:glycosyltransferase involved in cell wall biosynthesis